LESIYTGLGTLFAVSLDSELGWMRWVPLEVLAVQTLVVLPRLMERARVRVEGGEVQKAGSGGWHALYGVLELVKTGSVGWMAVKSAQYVLREV